MRRSWGRTLVLLGALIAVPACETVPVTGRSQLQLVSPAEESQMGADAYKQILAKAKISTDPAANQLVTRVGTRSGARQSAGGLQGHGGPKGGDPFAPARGKGRGVPGLLAGAEGGAGPRGGAGPGGGARPRPPQRRAHEPAARPRDRRAGARVRR